MNVKGVFMKNTDHWTTPKEIYEEFLSKGYFDPCPLHSQFNGLVIEWEDKTFVNPPYSQCIQWVLKAIEQAEKGKEIVMLVPSRTDTKWFHLLLSKPYVSMQFVKGRLKFGGSKNSAPFPSVFITLKKDTL